MSSAAQGGATFSLLSAERAAPYAADDGHNNSTTRSPTQRREGNAGHVSRGQRIVGDHEAASRGERPTVVYTAAGDTVRKITGPGYAGLQSVTWDLSREKPRPRELGGPTDPKELRQIEPGEYTVLLTVRGKKLSQKIRVEEWRAGAVGSGR